MKTVTQTIITNLAWGTFVLIGVSAVALWQSYEDVLVATLTLQPSKSLSLLGWAVAILLLVMSLLIARVIFLRRLLSDPFKGFSLEEQTGTALSKDGTRYCPNCLVNHIKVRMIPEGEDHYRCLNKGCPNSHPRAATVTINPPRRRRMWNVYS